MRRVNNDKHTDSEGSNGKAAGSHSNNGNGRVRRRRFLQATGAAGAAALAGCPLGGGGGGTTPSGDVTIGVLAPAPSDNPIGAAIANSAELAAQQINDDGGLLGADVTVDVRDTAEDPATGRTKYQELTVGEDVDLTTGIFTSEVLLNVLDDISTQQTVHMTTGAATPEASARVNEDYENFKYHFRTGPINAHHLGVNMIDFVEAMSDDLGWESVAVLVEDYEWTNPVQAVLDDQLADTGVDVATTERYAAGTENFTPIYDQVEQSGADAAFTAMAHTGTPAIVSWARQQRPFEFGGIHVPSQLPAYYQLTQGACRYAVTQNAATPTSEITEKTVPYANDYREAYGQFPVYTGYITFDAVKQYAEAVRSAGSIAADDVVTALEDSSFTGTAGTIEYYGPDHEFAHDVIYDPENVYPVYQQWQESEGSGVQEVLFPGDLSTADYARPPWV